MPSSPERKCPSCAAASITLEAQKLALVTIERCRACCGVWVGAAAFGELATQALGDNAVDDLDVSVPVALESDAAVAYRPCPDCGEMMNRVHFGRSSGVIVDVCREHGLWFDRDELSNVLAWVRRTGQVNAVPPSSKGRSLDRRQPSVLDELLPIKFQSAGSELKNSSRKLRRWAYFAKCKALGAAS